jgi:hypothetical protein
VVSVRAANLGEPFVFGVVHDGGRIYVLSARGHMQRSDVGSVCAALESALGSLDGFCLLIDSRELTGFDVDARGAASAWARSAVAARGAYFAVVADSELAAVESPLVALAVPGRARLFASREGALRYLGGRDVQSSGTFPVSDAAREIARESRQSRG